MMRVKTLIQADQYGGLGLFAGEDIEKGTVVWEYNDKTTEYFPVSRYFALNGKEKEEVECFGYPVFSLDASFKKIGVLLCLDDSRYFNHSENPNTGPQNIGGGSLDSSQMDHALRDIKKGEELTSNYFEYDPDNIIHEIGIKTCKSFLLTENLLTKTTSKLVCM